MSFVFTAAGTLEHGDGSLITGGVFQISSPSSSKVFAVGSGVYSGPLIYQFQNGSDLTQPSPIFVAGSIASLGPQTIVPTAIKVLADGSLLIRDGDTGIMNCSGALIAGGTGTISGPVITVAAQDRFDAE